MGGTCPAICAEPTQIMEDTIEMTSIGINLAATSCVFFTSVFLAVDDGTVCKFSVIIPTLTPDNVIYASPARRKLSSARRENAGVIRCFPQVRLYFFSNVDTGQKGLRCK